MPWLQLTISSSEDNATAVGDQLLEFGAQAVTYKDGADSPIFEPPKGSMKLWQHTLVTGLFEADTNVTPIVQQLTQLKLIPQPAQYKVDGLEDKDWEREWMDNFHPIAFGQRLWICPTWRDIPEPEAVNIMLDPGMAFGTGTHPTTAMCLRWLDAHAEGYPQVVDFGCGSGILGIAALKLGAEQAIGIDIDQQALIATKDNAERNDVADRFQVYLPSQQPQTQARLVMANVLAGPLRELADTILSYVEVGGQLLLSGILIHQAEHVMAAYRPYIDFSTPVTEGDWVMLAGVRKQ